MRAMFTVIFENDKASLETEKQERSTLVHLCMAYVPPLMVTLQAKGIVTTSDRDMVSAVYQLTVSQGSNYSFGSRF